MLSQIRKRVGALSSTELYQGYITERSAIHIIVQPQLLSVSRDRALKKGAQCTIYQVRKTHKACARDITGAAAELYRAYRRDISNKVAKAPPSTIMSHAS